MNSNQLIKSSVSIILMMIVQVIFFKNLALFGVAFCFLYTGIILLLPIQVKPVFALVMAFLLGLILDIFYDSIGIHTAAFVLMAYLRFQWLRVVTPTGGYDADITPSTQNLSVSWFASYAFPLLFIHHLAFFYIESISLNIFGFILLKAFSSAILTLIALIIMQGLFYSKRRTL
ncbi:rod shape-determining protein MreD [Penaeicola halotolerans]|uniref:rod shape-determining protein MreD n=1 Tax=Penaeicola halotolerans TaxID=2793196 RepID=UPI001CF91307|nr:rod shape-determining protein MreD [Penaeicola halotolerans]